MNGNTTKNGKVYDCNFKTKRFVPDADIFDVLALLLDFVPGLKIFIKPGQIAASLFSTIYREKKLLTSGASVFKKLMPKNWNAFVADGEENLIDLFSNAYDHIDKDQAFEHVNSAIPFCYSPSDEHTGHGFVYIPSQTEENKLAGQFRSIIYLHGAMGNLLWNIWALVTEFPNHIIVAPSGGYNWPSQDVEIINEYLDEICTHVERNFNVVIDRPLLIALSQGGPTGFKLAAYNTARFRGLVSIASMPGSSRELSYPCDFPILMINGTNDEHKDIEDAEEIKHELMQKGVNINLEKIEGANHFFYLARRAEMARIIREFDNKLAR